MRAAQIYPSVLSLFRRLSVMTSENKLRLDPELDRLNEYLEILKKNEHEALQKLRFLNSIINLMPVGLTVRSQQGKCLLANENAGYLSIAPNVASESPASDNLAKIGDTNAWPNIIRSGLSSTTEERVGQGHNERVFLTYHKVARIDDEPLLLSASVDFTDRKQQEDALSQRAYLDELTALPNRVLIEDHVERLISSGEQSRGRFALAFIDLDNFKHINDYYTHAIGDALLKKVAQRITSHIRSSDVLGRISGDEFLLVVHPLEHEEELSAIIDRLMKDLKEAFFIEQFEIFTSASMGLSIYPDHGQTYEMLRRNADTAMYRVKAEAKGGVAITISINIAARQAGDAHFMRAFCDELIATNCARRFMIEVTEDAFIAKNAFQSDVMPMLRKFGIKVSIDDFGVGYSLLATLAGITADEIKIDRSFITNIHKQPRSQSVLKAVEALSNALEMTVIAEGIETYEELAFLQAATRIRYGQGYYFARPLLIDELDPRKRSTIRTNIPRRHYSEAAKKSRSR
jgi:diguanylate cyclase (GGDEF)-like protein